MDVIETRIDLNSESYKTNYKEMTALVEDLNQELDIAMTQRSPKAIARHEESGKIPAEKKLELLLDRNTPFLEIAPLAAKGLYDGKIHKAGLICGIGMVSGKECMITMNDATIKGGAMYPMSVKKTLRCQTIAMENRLPFINLMDSSGAFLPMQSEIFPDLDDGGRVFFNQARMSKMGIPQIVGVMGLCTAGGAYGVAMCDEIVHVKDHGAIFLGGPPLVKAATGDEVSADELGGPMVHCRDSGVSDYYAEDDPHAISIIRKIVKNLPDTEKAALSTLPPKPPIYDPRELYGIVSPDLSKPYDIREVIARVVDGSEFLEFKEMYGPTLVTGWAHIHG
ncbi:MAG: methylcrotonoyl-CoA carboxylase, partial [Desulfobacterales bacterium]|nr:methylcrotonoyl-CoA carboxylase [Desulfobacterales bacterium]